MYNSNFPILNILDIIRLKRKNTRQHTNCKACHVLSCRISGESMFFYNNTSFAVRAGDILYIPYGASYSQECKSEDVICFHLEAYNQLSDHIMLFQSKAADVDKICSLFRSAAEMWKSNQDNCECRCMALLYEILSAGNVRMMEPTAHPTILTNAISYLDQHIYDQDLTVGKLYQEANISRAYFNRIFRNTYHATPIEYMNNMRIKKAKFLLASGNYTNPEIAWLCGFKDVKYFYVVFKKITGMTTKEYKRSQK